MGTRPLLVALPWYRFVHSCIVPQPLAIRPVHIARLMQFLGRTIEVSCKTLQEDDGSWRRQQNILPESPQSSSGSSAYSTESGPTQSDNEV